MVIIKAQATLWTTHYKNTLDTKEMGHALTHIKTMLKILQS